MDDFDFRARRDSGVSDDIENLAYKVIGAALEVHRELGPGLAESHYQKAMSRELALLGISHAVEVEIDVLYKGAEIGKARLDLLVNGVLIVELKAVEALLPVHRAQAVTYLKLTGLTLALLINFNTTILKDGIKRVINS